MVTLYCVGCYWEVYPSKLDVVAVTVMHGYAVCEAHIGWARQQP